MKIMTLIKYLKKTTIPDPTKINKTIKEIRKENCDEGSGFLIDPEKYH